MSGVLSAGARMAVLVIDAVNAYDSISRALQPCGERGIQIADAANRVALVSLSLAEKVMLAKGKNSKCLYKLKLIEAIPRGFNVPIQAILQGIRIEQQEHGLRGLIRFFEKGIIAPLADVLRVAAEQGGYYEKHFLEMSPEELKNAQRPIYELKDQGGTRIAEIVGHRPVDRKECEKNLASFRSMAETSLGVRLFAEAGGAEILISDVGLPLYERLALFLASQRQQPQEPAAEENQRAQAPSPERELLGFPSIPPPLHQDQVFRRFICPISRLPIRDPVRDPTDVRDPATNRMILYERAEIIKWVREHHTSPITRQPLEVHQLQEARGVRRLIDRRLQQHAEGLMRYLREHLNTPLDDPHLQEIANQFDDPGE